MYGTTSTGIDLALDWGAWDLISPETLLIKYYLHRAHFADQINT